MKVQVFSAQPVLANENSATFTSNGRKALLLAAGTWGSGTITAEVLVSGSTWVSLGLTLTANGKIEIDLPKGVDYRFTLTGATNPSLTVVLTKDERN